MYTHVSNKAELKASVKTQSADSLADHMRYGEAATKPADAFGGRTHRDDTSALR